MNRAERRRIEKQRRKDKTGNISSFEELLTSAVAELQNGNFAHADKLFAKLISKNPQEPTSLHFAGVTKYHQRLYGEAVDLLGAAIKIAPNYAQAYNSLGIVYFDQREFNQAQQSFQTAISIKPDYSNAHTNLGNTLVELDEISEAVSCYEAALTYDQHNLEAGYKLSAAHLTMDNPEDALASADNCLLNHRYCQNAYAYKAIALSRLDRKSEWLELYNYEEMIHKVNISIPTEFSSLESFNSKLEHDIRDHPTLTWEPLDRVTNGGAVTKDIAINPTVAIKAFESALRRSIDLLIEQLHHQSGHPFYSRIPKKRYNLTLIASILRARGWHPPHIHESSWLSGVYYVKVPSIVNADNKQHEGWLQFGLPNIELSENWIPDTTEIKPEEGSIVSFPSYFFHGTIPYHNDDERIGIAFDVYPA
ncbi:MAG: putative 2OG-Fe(II) oxygenase [Gammaproteobacteria bacterium]|nr:putative 2OG-Fe(II) oxygenase [Gammaproteobacteria bacterium]